MVMGTRGWWLWGPGAGGYEDPGLVVMGNTAGPLAAIRGQLGTRQRCRQLDTAPTFTHRP